MSSSDSPLPAHWQFYSERARQTHDGRVDDLGYGREELLWETLGAIENGVMLTDGCRQQLDRIPWNRAKKHRRLRLYLMGNQVGQSVRASSCLGRQRLAGEMHIKGAHVDPGGADMTCRTCGKAMTPAEETVYGSRCEDCWSGQVAGVEVDEPDAVVRGVSIDQVRVMLSPGEWEVECCLAAGQTYAEVARDRGLSADVLKVRASRWRARIRPKLAVLVGTNC